MKHIIVAHRYEHATWFRNELMRELKDQCLDVRNADVSIVIGNIYRLHGLINATVYVLDAPRYTLSAQQRENRFYAKQILYPQAHRITIKEIELP